MGTRADFYIGRGENAEWLGSIAWDGYPDGEASGLFGAESEGDFRDLLTTFSAKRDDWTSIEQGWPWPWEDSRTTDYAYAFDDGTVWVSRFGQEWQVASKYDGDAEAQETAVFPNMTAIKNVAFGERSGVIVIST